MWSSYDENDPLFSLHIDDDRDYLVQATEEEIAGMNAVTQYTKARGWGPDTENLIALDRAGLSYQECLTLYTHRDAILDRAIRTTFATE